MAPVLLAGASAGDLPGVVAHGLLAAMDDRVADLGEAERRVEGIGGRVGRVGVDLAGDDAVAGARDLGESSS